jgi:lipopolysaccharide/colanic/teichoic acid biosynthesis glycosyltransferase
VTLLRAASESWALRPPRPGPVPPLRGVEGSPPVLRRTRRSPARLLDVVLAGLGLLVLAPFLLGIGVLIRATSRGPALFRQTRLGLEGRPFVMLKFRTMYAGVDDRLHRAYIEQLLQDPSGCLQSGLYKLVDDPRVTPLGRWLRRTSLDELPQLVNVLRGEMVLVGPRPVLPWEAELFGRGYERRFTVAPGMTGLWQTTGRNCLTMREALELDLRYVDTRSLRLDIAILVRTVRTVLGREGVW